MVADNQDTLRSAMKGLDTFAQTLARNGERVDNLMVGIDFLVNKDGSGEFQKAAVSLRELGDNLDKRTADISVGINRFTSNGSKDLAALVLDGRKALADISRAFSNLDKNPSRLLFGGAGSEPEPRPQAPPKQIGRR